MSAIRGTVRACACAALLTISADCALLERVDDPAQLATDAVCLGLTALVDDGTRHEICATAQELAPFVDVLLKRRREGAAPPPPPQAKLRPLRMRAVRVKAAELAALDCSIPANHPSQQP
jgi:hypothetical protein